MDKADFIKLAPVYYTLAIVIEAKGIYQSYFSETRLREAYTVQEDGTTYCHLEHTRLLRHSLNELVEAGALKRLQDPFGPSLYEKAEEFEPYYQALELDIGSPFYKAKASEKPNQWIRSALIAVNAEYSRLDVSQSDLENPEAEWEPIPIDRDSEAFLKAEAALDKTIEEVEKSNGYADQHPEERNYVLDNLKSLSTKLKTSTTVSIAYVKAHGLNVLAKLSQRFGNAAIGKIVDVAIKAILTWLGL